MRDSNELTQLFGLATHLTMSSVDPNVKRKSESCVDGAIV